MLHNYAELRATITRYEIQLDTNSYEMSYLQAPRHAKALVEALVKRDLIKKIIVMCLALYCDKMRHNYLEEKLHGAAFRLLLLKHQYEVVDSSLTSQLHRHDFTQNTHP